MLNRKKKLKFPKIYGVIRFTPEAEKWCVGGESNMKILLYDKNKNLREVLDYSQKRIEQLNGLGIPIVARELGLPKVCMRKKADIYYTFGKIQFR